MWAARAARLKAEKEEIEKMEEPVRLKKMITKYYYLTPQFIQEIEKVPMRKGKPGEIEIRIKKTEKGPKIIGREKTTWYGKYYYPREGAKEFVSIIKSRPTTVFHELLHSHFFKKRYSSKTFNQIWERSKKEPGGEMLVWIDRRILRNYERIHRFPYSFAQERYAHFGAELGGYGKAAKRLEDIPPGLRFYYSDIILSRTKMPSIAKPTPFA